MSDIVNKAFVQQYSTNVGLLLQQEGSRLRGACMSGTHVGKFVSPIEQIGAVNAVRRTTRHADTPLVFTPHQKRWLAPVDYEVADLLDSQDQLRMLIDPKSPYARVQAAAIGRSMDSEIITAFTATALIGENGTDTEAFDTTNYQVAVGASGLTVAKLRSAKRKLMAANVNIDTDSLYVTYTAAQHDDLLGELQVASLDYNTKPVLVDGRVTSFMGFQFIHTELLPKVSTTRSCFAWAKSGMYFGSWQDIASSVDKRPDKSNSWQVYSKGTFGASRLEQGRVVEILCNEP